MAPVLTAWPGFLEELCGEGLDASGLLSVVVCLVACVIRFIWTSPIHVWNCFPARVPISHQSARSYPRRPPKGWSTILKLLARFSLLNLPLASAGDAGDDFTNNLFSDLAPLLALFGEQVAKQYMSHSMSRIESFIFAMGPLGILTAVTGAIRVGGPTWLKALIGRAREGNGVVELELMSSTSADVCEMWNGNGVSRLMGTGEQVSVIEIIYYNEDADRTDQDPPSSSILRGFLWMRSQLEHFIGRFGRDVSKPSRSRADSPTPLLPYRQMAPLEPGFTQILNLQEAYRRGALKRCQCPDFPGSAKADQMTSSSHRTISDNEMLDDIPPNLGINLGRSRLSRTELMFAATIGVGLQAAVVAFAGIGAFHPVFKHDPDFQKEGRTIPTFAFPIFASGSLAVSLGTFLCAHIVEVSTQEITWEASTRLAKGLRMIWLQKGGFVNDQQFFSYTLSRRQRSNRIGGKALHVTRSCKANGKSVNTLTVSASVSTIVGFILQFIGLRNLSWTVSIAQLGVIGFMTAVRAFLRRGLVLNEVASHKLEEGQELASVVRTISGCDFFSIITAPQSIPEIRHHDPWKKRSAASDRRRASLAFLPHAVHVLQLSSQLRDFTNWENPRAAKAQALFECIEHTLQTYSSNDFELSVLHGRDTFSWNVLIEYSGSGQGDSGGNGTNLVEFRFSAWRERYSAGRGWGVWKLDREAKEQIGWAILQWEHEQFISTQTGTPDTPNSFRLIDTPREVYEAWISRGSVPSTLASIKMDRALTEGSSLSKSGIRIIGAHSEPRELPDSSLLLEVPPYNGDTTIYCQSFFSLFFSALSQYVRPLRSNDILYVCSGALNSESGPLITKASLRIRSRKLSALVDRLASIGLGNTEDILCCIVPALHSASHLPRTAFTVDTGTQCKWVFDEIQQEVAKLLRAGHIREADSLLLWLLDFTVTSASRIAASTRLQPFRHRKWQNILQLYGYILDVYDEVRNSMGADYARRAAHLVELVLEQSTVELMSSNEVLVYRDSVDLLVSKMENLVPDSRSLRQPWRKERWEKVMRLRHANEIRHLDRHCEGDSGAYIESFLSGGLVNDPECVLWLVHTMQKQGPDFNTVAGTTVRVDSSIALVSSALNRNTVAVQLLIEDPNTEFEVVDSMGRTAIHYAATGGMTSMLQLLLCDVRSRTVLEYEDNDGNTALQIAELNGDGAAVKLLLFYGAQAAENWAALDGYSCGLLHEKFMLDPDSRQTSPLQSVVRHSRFFASSSTNNRTALHWAAWCNSWSSVWNFVKLADDPVALAEWEKRDGTGNTPLDYAIRNGAIPVIDQLLTKAPRLFEYQRGITEFAVRWGHESIIQLLLEKDFDFGWSTCYGRTPLHIASELGRAPVVRLLLNSALKLGLDINYKDQGAQTALQRALEKMPSKDVIQMLVLGQKLKSKVNVGKELHKALYFHGAETGDIRILSQFPFLKNSELSKSIHQLRDGSGRSLLMVASKECREDAVRFLLDGDGANNIDLVDDFGHSALFQALDQGSQAIVRLLALGMGIDVGMTSWPLSLCIRAAMRDDPITLRAILSTDVPCFAGVGKARDASGRTALSVAAEHGCSLTVQLLLEQEDLDVEQTDNVGREPLSYAAENNHAIVCALLLSRCRSRQQRLGQARCCDRSGRSPLAYATANGHSDVLQVLSASEAIDYYEEINSPTSSRTKLLSTNEQEESESISSNLIVLLNSEKEARVRTSETVLGTDSIRLYIRQYTIAWFCRSDSEYQTAKQMLDIVHGVPYDHPALSVQGFWDVNDLKACFVFGRIHCHNVVIVLADPSSTPIRHISPTYLMAVSLSSIRLGFTTGNNGPGCANTPLYEGVARLFEQFDVEDTEVTTSYNSHPVTDGMVPSILSLAWKARSAAKRQLSESILQPLSLEDVGINLEERVLGQPGVVQNSPPAVDPHSSNNTESHYFCGCHRITVLPESFGFDLASNPVLNHHDRVSFGDMLINGSKDRICFCIHLGSFDLKLRLDLDQMEHREFSIRCLVLGSGICANTGMEENSRWKSNIELIGYSYARELLGLISQDEVSKLPTMLRGKIDNVRSEQ